LAKVLSEEEKVRNLMIFTKGLESVGVDTDKLCELYGGKIRDATITEMDNFGLAYDGSLLEFNFKLCKLAKKMVEFLPEESRPEINSITKVALLSNLGKIQMYTPTTEQWKKNRGINYDFIDNDMALRSGQRTVYILHECGIDLTPHEYETILNFDSLKDDTYVNINSSTLSRLIFIAREFAFLESKIINSNNENNQAF
jgi:hypothetical protein